MTEDAFLLPDSVSRRDFLKMSAMAWLGLGLPLRWRKPSFRLEEQLLGRVTTPTVDVYAEPSFASRKVATQWRDDVLQLKRAVLGGAQPEHNRVWYEVEKLGFVHSSPVQPVQNNPNEPLLRVAASHRLFEVTVPYADAYWKPSTNGKRVYRFYYGSTYWVNGVNRDGAGRLWYRIMEDWLPYEYYAPAEAFRPVPPEELAPISAHVPAGEKRIEVDLQRQWVRCYESGDEVFTTKTSSGKRLADGGYWTPSGEFVTFRKRASRHMAAGNRASGFDLPGVPWVSYFTDKGVSFHGTYWHNDYGTPRSHGCVNLTPQAAKWIYRWTTPTVPAWDREVAEGVGSVVRVHV